MSPFKKESNELSREQNRNVEPVQVDEISLELSSDQLFSKERSVGENLFVVTPDKAPALPVGFSNLPQNFTFNDEEEPKGASRELSMKGASRE